MIIENEKEYLNKINKLNKTNEDLKHRHENEINKIKKEYFVSAREMKQK